MIPSSKIVRKVLALKELSFHPLQEVRMWVPGTQVTYTASAGSVISKSDVLDPTTTGASALIAPLWTQLAAVFQEFILLHCRVTIVPVLGSTSGRTAYVAANVTNSNAIGGTVTATLAAGGVMVPLSAADQSITQFTAFSRDYLQLSWNKVSVAAPEANFLYIDGDSTTGIVASIPALAVYPEYYMAFRGIKP